MNNCKKCGKAVRLRAYKVTVSRKRGVCNYIEHIEGNCDAAAGYDAITMKTDKIKNYDLLIERWNKEQQP